MKSQVLRKYFFILECLTPRQFHLMAKREYEIAVRVSKGDGNKQVAQSLKITECTVKANLTEVYRKLGVVDRLKLARILFGEERQVRRSVTQYPSSRFSHHELRC